MNNLASLYQSAPLEATDDDYEPPYDPDEPFCRACQNSGFVESGGGVWGACSDCQPQAQEYD